MRLIWSLDLLTREFISAVNWSLKTKRTYRCGCTTKGIVEFTYRIFSWKAADAIKQILSCFEVMKNKGKILMYVCGFG